MAGLVRVRLGTGAGVRQQSNLHTPDEYEFLEVQGIIVSAMRYRRWWRSFVRRGRRRVTAEKNTPFFRPFMQPKKRATSRFH